VDASSAYRRVCRVIAPAGESLWCSHNFAARSERTPAARPFVASNESNQSKDALHFAVPLRMLPSATCRLWIGPDHGTPVQRIPPLGSLRIAIAHDAKRGGIGKVCEANDRIALGPRGRRRGAQGFGAARASALRQLTSRRLSERSERSERSEFGAGPEHRAPQSSPARAGPPPSGRLFFGDFLLAKQKKVTALSGAYPDAASRSEQEVRVSRHGASIPQPERVVACEPGFDRLSPNGWGGWRYASKASTGSARTDGVGWRYANKASTSSARTGNGVRNGLRPN